MNDDTKQAAIRTAAETIMTAFSPLRMDGESIEDAAIRCISQYRRDSSSEETRRQCRAFFDIHSRHFIGFKDAGEQAFAIVRSFSPSCRDKARAMLESRPERIPAIYRQFMGDALYFAYRQDNRERKDCAPMSQTIFHGVEITDRAGKLDFIMTPDRASALTLARQLYRKEEARANRWTCFFASYTKRGTYSRLDGYELIPQA